jgi:hypothetical protein
MPDRILRAGILTSESVTKLSWGAEVFYRRLFSIADDFGRYDGRKSILRAQLYPLQLDKVGESDIGKWMLETAEAGLVRFYAVEGEELLEIAKFDQRVRSTKSKWKSPQVADGRGQMSADDGHPPPYSESESESESYSRASSETVALCRGGEAQIPTKEEFRDRFTTVGIPEAYLDSKWAWFEGNNAWLDQSGRLKRYDVLVTQWWKNDRPTWRGGGRKNGVDRNAGTLNKPERYKGVK